jgi:hydroxyacylglutathione hydrolase
MCTFRLHAEEKTMAGLEVEVVPLLSDNYAYILHDTVSGATAVVDPSVGTPIRERLRAEGRGLEMILLTHHHGDHVGGVDELKREFGSRVIGPEGDRGRISEMDQGVREGDVVQVGGAHARVLETPGHTRNHISFVFDDDQALFCGDTLFALGCGRLLEGDARTMWGSLSKLLPLPDDMWVYCGHEYTQSNARFALTIDPDNPELAARAKEVEALRAKGQPTIPSRLGTEKATNPFLRPGDPEIRRRLGMERAQDHEVFGEIRRRKDAA